MKQNILPLEQDGMVYFRGYGSLRVIGWERAEVSVEAGYYSVEPAEQGMRIKALESCDLFVPSGAHLVIERVGGDLNASNLSGGLMVERVTGQASFFQVGAVQVGKISGDCSVRSATGSFSVEKVGGGFEAADLAAGLIAGRVGGDLRVSGLQGGFEGRVGGDLSLGLLDTAPTVNARAGGDLALYLSPGTTARFSVDSGGEDIRVQVGDQPQRIEKRNTIVTLGAGDVTGTLRAGGSVIITDQPFSATGAENHPFDRLEERIGARIRERVQRLDEMLPNLNEHTNRIAQDAQRLAEERIHAAMQQIDSSLGVQIPPILPIPPAPPVPGRASVTAEAVQPAAPADWVADEERLIILRMLQEKKITVEQAEALLEALDTPGEF